MKTLRRSFTAVFLGVLLFGAHASPAEVTLSVNTGHIGTVRALAFQKAGNLLFSGGDDGTVKIWDAATQSLISSIHITSLQIRMIAVNEAASHFAVVETNGTSMYRISAWDWKLQKQLFILELDEYPLSLGYSPKGSFLAYSETDWQSLTFLESRTGRMLPYLRQGFGIVSHLAVSDTEGTLITYNPLGSISYWDLKTSALKYQFKTLANLSAMSVNGTKRYLAATDGKRLLYIDLTRDMKFAQAFLPNINQIRVHPETGLIVCYTKDPVTGVKSVTLWDYASDRLVPRSFNPALPQSDILDLTASGDNLYLAFSDGTIRQLSTDTGTAIDFPGDVLSPVHGLGITDDTAFVNTGSTILTFASDFFRQKRENPPATYFRTSSISNPLGRPSAISVLSPKEILLWSTDELPGSIFRLNTTTGTGEELKQRFVYPLKDLDILNQNLAALDRGGFFRVLDLNTMSTMFDYSSISLQSAALTSPRYVLLGQNSINQSGAPLLRIDLSTGETVPIGDTDLMVFSLEPDRNNDRFFSLGLETIDTTMYTVLKVHKGSSLDAGLPLLSHRGEDLGAAILYDHEDNTLYTTLGSDVVRKWNGNSLTSYERTNHIPRKLFRHEDLLLSINSDKTVSVWNRKTGVWMLDFYPFAEGSWTAVFSDGTFYSSPGGSAFLNAFSEGTKIPLESRRRFVGDDANRVRGYSAPY